MNTASSAGSEDRVDDLSEVATDTDQQIEQGSPGSSDAKQDDAADTSVAAGEKGAKQPEEDTLEAVVRRAAQGEDSKGAKGTPTDGKGSEGADAATDAEAGDKKAEDKDADVPFHKHPRWQEMLRERDTLKGQVDTFKEKAERFDHIGNFMNDNHLSSDEMVKGFEIMALMKNDPAKALEALAPYLSNLELATGQKLPDDLQGRVDRGTITPEDAQELARTRMEASANRAVADRTASEAQAERERLQAERAQSAAQVMQGAVTKWEEGIKQRDPDYSHKQRFVTDRVRALMAEKGRPANAEAAVAIVEEAYAEVTEQMRKVLPKREQVRNVTSEQSSTRATAVPKTMEEAIRGALRK